jgi:hypothetical protein
MERDETWCMTRWHPSRTHHGPGVRCGPLGVAGSGGTTEEEKVTGVCQEPRSDVAQPFHVEPIGSGS